MTYVTYNKYWKRDDIISYQHLNKLIEQLPFKMGYTKPDEQQAIRALFCNDFILTSKKQPCILLTCQQFLAIYSVNNRHSRYTPKRIVDALNQPYLQPIINGMNDLYRTDFFTTINAVCRCRESDVQRLSKTLATSVFVLIVPQLLKYKIIPMTHSYSIRFLGRCLKAFMSCSIVGHINLLLQSSISSYRIMKRSLVNKSTIIKLRHHQRQAYNLTINTALRLDKLYQRLGYKAPSELTYRHRKFILNKPLVKLNQLYSFDHHIY